MKHKETARIVLAASLLLFLSFQSVPGETNLEAALHAFRKAAASNVTEDWLAAGVAARIAADAAKAEGDFRTECAAVQLLVSAADEANADVETQESTAKEMHELVVTSLKDKDITGVDCSPDGRLAAFIARNGVEVWDITKRKPLLSLARMPEEVGFAYFTGDGKHLMVGEGRVIQIWDIETGKWIDTMRGCEENISAGLLSKDKRYLCVSERYGWTVGMFDLKEQKLLWRGDAAQSSWHRVTVTPDCGRVLLRGEDEVVLADGMTGKQISKVSFPGVLSTCYFLDETTVLLTRNDSTASVWRAADGVLTDLGRHGFITDAIPIPGGKLFAVSTSEKGMKDCRVTFYDSGTCRPKASFLVAGAQWVRRLVLCGDLVAALCEKAPSVILAADGSGPKGVIPLTYAVDAALTPDGFLVVGGLDKFGMFYLPSFEKSGQFTILSGVVDSFGCVAVATGIRLLLAEYAKTKDEEVLRKALSCARIYSSTALSNASPFETTAAYALLAEVYTAMGKVDEAAQMRTKGEAPIFKAEGGRILGTGFADAGRSLTWATASGYFRKGITDESRTETVPEDWSKVPEVFIGPHSGAIVAAKDPGCYVIYRDCHNAEFPFLKTGRLLDVSFSDRGVEAALIMDDCMVLTEFWDVRICAKFDVTGLHRSQVKLNHENSFAMPDGRSIGFYEYNDRNTDARHDNTPAYFSIPDALPGAVTALDVDSSDKFLCACDGQGNVGIWGVDFDLWRGKMPSWAKDRKPYDPAKGKIPLKTFESGITNADLITFSSGKDPVIVLGSQTSGEFAAFKEDGKKLASVKGDPGRATISGDRRTIALRGNKTVSVLRPAEGIRASYGFDEEISSIALSPDGAFLFAGSESGNLYLRFVEAALK
ncbi:MAG: WD40 repeat domain-containing protein [Candidatus Brocadiia bacterium]